MNNLLSPATLGLTPTSPVHALGLLVPIAGWLVTWRLAKRKHITIIHNASLAVSYWEELLFRGVGYGILIAAYSNPVVAIAGSSVLFSLLHLRNLWWASPKRLLFQCLHTGLFFGPIAGLLRWWGGDIYLPIAFHAINNFVVIASPYSAPKPSDESLRAKAGQMTWWQRGFIGLWSVAKPKHG